MINPHDHQVYAVKELTNLTLEDGSTDETAMFELLAEVRKMGVVESQFIVQYRTSAVFGGRFYVMMEPIASIHFAQLTSQRGTPNSIRLCYTVMYTAWGRLLRRCSRAPSIGSSLQG